MLFENLLESGYEKIENEIFIDCQILKTSSTKKERDPDLAYVISTSGTTGSPKIIEVCNSSIIPNIIELSKMFKLNDKDVIFQASPLTFDPSLVEIFCSLYSRSSLLIVPKIFKLMSSKLENLLKTYKVTTLQLTPTLFKNLKKLILEIENLKRLIIGGEQFPRNDEAIKKMLNSNVAVYNIYGITELSCWSTCHQVTHEDLEDLNGVPVVGQVLAETKLWLRTNDNQILDIEDCLNRRIDGLLLHSSETRKCLINGQSKKFIDSGDKAVVFGRKVYLHGRDDRVVKINGKLTDLNLLEQTAKCVDGVINCVGWFHHENYLTLFVFANNKIQVDLIEHIKENLPAHYEPQKLVFLDDQNVPFTSHGKIDIKKLAEIHLKANSQFDHKELNSILKELWKKWIKVEPKDEDNFITSGGDSLKAVSFLTDLDIEMKHRNIRVKTDFVLDVLLNEKFSSLEKVFASSDETVSQLTDVKETSVKRFKTDTVTEMSHLVVNWYTKCTRYAKPGCEVDFVFNKGIEFVWKTDTLKCVDASPLVIATEDGSVKVLIGSHSHRFICVDGLTGRLVWTFLATDRIESSACLSKCGRYVIFGSYDKNVYILNAENGSLVWQVETQDVVKSSPCVDLKSGLVYFGSHDKHLYCVNIEEKTVVWKRVLDNSSIFAGPNCDQKTSIYISTLGGSLFSLNKYTHDINWRFVLDKPAFTSPIFNKEETSIFIGTCGGIFYCISFNGEKIWEFKTEFPIFSNACSIGQLVLFGCHDKHFYCLHQKDGSLVWKSNLMSEIYSSPFGLGSQVLCISCDGLLRLFDSNGKIDLEKSLFEQKNICYSSPIIHRNRLFIGSRNNFLYSFKLV